ATPAADVGDITDPVSPSGLASDAHRAVGRGSPGHLVRPAPRRGRRLAGFLGRESHAQLREGRPVLPGFLAGRGDRRRQPRRLVLGGTRRPREPPELSGNRRRRRVSLLHQGKPPGYRLLRPLLLGQGGSPPGGGPLPGATRPR